MHCVSSSLHNSIFEIELVYVRLRGQIMDMGAPRGDVVIFISIDLDFTYVIFHACHD
jgi:hypothetical protein